MKAGFQIDEVLADDGVSGISTKLCERPEGKRLYDKLRAGDVLVVRWVDRLGRNYSDVTEVIREFMERGVIIKTVINGMVFDGATREPMQMAVRDALISFLAATAQAQAEATRESQKAGIAYAKVKQASIGAEKTVLQCRTDSTGGHPTGTHEPQRCGRNLWPFRAKQCSASPQIQMLHTLRVAKWSG